MVLISNRVFVVLFDIITRYIIQTDSLPVGVACKRVTLTRLTASRGVFKHLNPSHMRRRRSARPCWVRHIDRLYMGSGVGRAA